MLCWSISIYSTDLKDDLTFNSLLRFVDMATREAFSVSLNVLSFGEQRSGALLYGLCLVHAISGSRSSDPCDVSMESRDVAFQGFISLDRPRNVSNMARLGTPDSRGALYMTARLGTPDSI